MVRQMVDVFDSTIQKTDVWLKKLMDRMGWNDRHRSYIGLRAVLHALRDRLTVEAAAKFAAQLPMLIRGFYYEGWVPSSTPIKVHSKSDFFHLVEEHLKGADIETDIEFLTKQVFQVVQEMIGSGEVKTIQAILPAPLQELWKA